MNKTTCKIDDCETTSHARGYCRSHYRKLMAYGDPLWAPSTKPNKYCEVPRCEKKARTKTAKLCPMHYHRQYRGRKIGGAEEWVRKSKTGSCAVKDCENTDSEGIYCSMHAARMRRHGDTEKVISPSERYAPSGEDNHKWKGSDVGYTAAHDRVRRARGSASNHDCVDCGEPAYHWSYDHECENEQVRFERGYYVSLSPYIDHYQPRCVPCHKRFDLGRDGSSTRLAMG